MADESHEMVVLPLALLNDLSKFSCSVFLWGIWTKQSNFTLATSVVLA
jgi:hypothetical protein